MNHPDQHDQDLNALRSRLEYGDFICSECYNIVIDEKKCEDCSKPEAPLCSNCCYIRGIKYRGELKE